MERPRDEVAPLIFAKNFGRQKAAFELIVNFSKYLNIVINSDINMLKVECI